MIGSLPRGLNGRPVTAGGGRGKVCSYSSDHVLQRRLVKGRLGSLVVSRWVDIVVRIHGSVAVRHTALT